MGWGYVESIYRSNTLCIGPNSEPTKTNPRRGRGPRHLPPSAITGQFFKKSRHLGVWCLNRYLLHGVSARAPVRRIFVRQKVCYAPLPFGEHISPAMERSNYFHFQSHHNYIPYRRTRWSKCMNLLFNSKTVYMCIEQGLLGLGGGGWILSAEVSGRSAGVSVWKGGGGG